MSITNEVNETCTSSVEELESAMKDKMAELQTLNAMLAVKKGIPIEEPCKLCEGTGTLKNRGLMKEGEEKVCFSCGGKKMKPLFWPRVITGADWSQKGNIMSPGFMGYKEGSFVAIRPCEAEYNDKTFLGIYLGEMALSLQLGYNPVNGNIIPQHSFHNPAIFVPDISKIIYGCGSWWGQIESEDQLKQITNNDINNVWYVKALKQLSEDTTEDGLLPGEP